MLLGELIDVFKKAHPDMDEHEFFAMITADPTIVTNDRGSFCGRYCTWIGNQYVGGKIKIGDAPELRSALTTYDKNKSQLKPVKEVKDLDELIGLVKDLSDDFKPARNISKGEQELEKVYEDDEWIVYIPHSFKASRKIGGDTRWCTAASNGQKRFDYYTKQGPLYVNIRKSDGEKFQFHFETESFMDKNDMHINLKNLNLQNGIVDFYGNIYQYFKLCTIYERVLPSYNFSDDLISVAANGKWSFAHKDGTLFADNKWFERISKPFNGLVAVAFTQMGDFQNYINEKGDLLLKQNYDLCEVFSNNFGIVAKRFGKKLKYNYIDKNGNLLLLDFVDGCCRFNSNNRAFVIQDNKYRLINGNGEYVSGLFDYISDFCIHGVFIVKIDDLFNLIDAQGKIVLGDWVDEIKKIGDFFAIKRNEKYTIVDALGKQKISFWFDNYALVLNDNIDNNHDIIIASVNNIIRTIIKMDSSNISCFDLVPNNNLICQ